MCWSAAVAARRVWSHRSHVFTSIDELLREAADQATNATCHSDSRNAERIGQDGHIGQYRNA